jgi:energy-coupling factor transporter ATP-binding protein EcfA2
MVKQLAPDEVASSLPSGARFFRCALQVNPFEYLKRHGKSKGWSSEPEYNRAMVDGMVKNAIEVIAITDHFNIHSSLSLASEARKAGLHVFCGIEAKSKEGIHLLCLFDADKDVQSMTHFIGECGIHGDQDNSPNSKCDVGELLALCKQRQAVCLAPQVTMSCGGLLTVLKGQARAAAWRLPDLLACSIPGAVKDLPQEFKSIIENRDAAHRRDRPVAVLNTKDVISPDGFADPGTWSWIKMSTVSIEALRQAFIDPASRIRLASDPLPQAHAELIWAQWEGGFLDGLTLHLNENLNVIIGGRGTGKSSIIESIRYALNAEPRGPEAKRSHESIIKHVIKSGTKISLRIQLSHPIKTIYTVTRTVPNPPITRDESGAVVTISPLDLLPSLEIYGQHELAELGMSEDKLIHLLQRFRSAPPEAGGHTLPRELKKVREQLLKLTEEAVETQRRLETLPKVQETLKQYTKAGVEDKLAAQSALVREEKALSTASERLDDIASVAQVVREATPIDAAFLSRVDVSKSPNHDLLGHIAPLFKTLEAALLRLGRELEQALGKSRSELQKLRVDWQARRDDLQRDFERSLRELQKDRIDGSEFIRLRKQVEELLPLQERALEVQQRLAALRQTRLNQLAEWEGLQQKEYDALERAAKTVNRKLQGQVKVSVRFAGHREPLWTFLKTQIGGRLQETVEALDGVAMLSCRALAEHCRQGKDALVAAYKLPLRQAESLAQMGEATLMGLEELALPPAPTIELNVGEPDRAVWRSLSQLSTGQRATALLLLVLLESDAPLLIDQPEDDLDNRFITEGIVPRLREEKRRRQFVVATHNANIPVLGDAELIMGLTATGEAEHGKVVIADGHRGAIDDRPVRQLVEEVLEGGREAFMTRRLKYGF